MKPLVLDYLLDSTFDDLEKEHGITARPDNDLTKFSLNYDQLAAKSGAQISNECRGLIIRPRTQLSENWKLETVGECEIVAYPFNRFYNDGDGNAAVIDWHDSRLKVYDKLDGTMIALYWDSHKGKWCTATRSVSEADLPMNDTGLTFSQLFWQGVTNTFHAHNPGAAFVQSDLTDILTKNYTYIFELTSMHNRIVVKYPETRVTLLGIRNIETGREISLDSYKIGFIPNVHAFSARTPEDIKELVDSFKPESNEGVVVCDGHFNRIKVKSAAYVLSHRFKDALVVSRRDVVQSVLDDTIDDVLPLLEPEMAQHVEDLQERIRVFCRDTDSHYHVFTEAARGDRKEFAKRVQASGLWHPLFYQLADGKAENTLALLKSLAKSGKPTKTMWDNLIQVLRWKPDIK